MGFWESVMAQYAELNAAKASIPFHISMLHDFYQSFIEGDRWLQYLKGLGVSIEVTIGALILGIILGVLGVLALITMAGINFPWLSIGIPALTSFYFDWFGGCIQAFIFCTLTTIFIKQAAG